MTGEGSFFPVSARIINQEDPQTLFESALLTAADAHNRYRQPGLCAPASVLGGASHVSCH